MQLEISSNRTWIVVLSVITLGFIYLLAPILTPFVLGALFAYLLNPVIVRLTRLGLPRLVSITLVFTLSILIVALGIILLIPLLEEQINTLANTLPGMIDWVQNTLLPWLSRYLGSPGLLDIATLKKTLIDNWAKSSNMGTSFINTVVHSSLVLTQWIIKLVLTPVVTFYLLVDWNKLIRNLRDLLPRSIEPTVVHLIKECDKVLSAFFRGQFLVMLAVGFYYSIALSIAGLQIGILLGIIIGFTCIIPYLSVIVGLSIGSIAAYVQFGNFNAVLWVWLVFIIGHILESMILTPYLVGDRIGLHPVAVIFAVLAGGSLFGFFGVLLALPAAAVIMVWLRYLEQHYRKSRMYR